MKACLAMAAGLFLAAGPTLAQEKGQSGHGTREAPTVGKDVYDSIQSAREQVGARDYNGALRTLNTLREGKLTEYERANVLNYIGVVYYNMDNRRRSHPTKSC
jgi:hypothetical protein